MQTTLPSENDIPTQTIESGNKEIGAEFNQSVPSLDKVGDPTVQVLPREEEWSVVSPRKGCKSSEKKQSPLAYGEVQILSSTRFSVLEVEEEKEPDLGTDEGGKKQRVMLLRP